MFGTYRQPRIGAKGKLTGAHTQFLIDYIKKHLNSILEDIRQKLCETFTGMCISVSALHRHLVQKCRVTLKKLEKLPAARNADRVINLRKEKVEQWETMQDLDFAHN